MNALTPSAKSVSSISTISAASIAELDHLCHQLRVVTGTIQDIGTIDELKKTIACVEGSNLEPLRKSIAAGGRQAKPTEAAKCLTVLMSCYSDKREPSFMVCLCEDVMEMNPSIWALDAGCKQVRRTFKWSQGPTIAEVLAAIEEAEGRLQRITSLLATSDKLLADARKMLERKVRRETDLAFLKLQDGEWYLQYFKKSIATKIEEPPNCGNSEDWIENDRSNKISDLYNSERWIRESLGTPLTQAQLDECKKLKAIKHRNGAWYLEHLAARLANVRSVSDLQYYRFQGEDHKILDSLGTPLTEAERDVASQMFDEAFERAKRADEAFKEWQGEHGWTKTHAHLFS